MRARHRCAAAAVALAMHSDCATAVSFTGVLATDLEPLFQIDAPWLGADIATSLPLAGHPGTYLWLHGDTLIGSVDGQGNRVVDGMPRNSLALLNVSSASGHPTSPYAHFISSNSSDPVHHGFFSPPNASQWYWPIAGASLPGGETPLTIVIADRMEMAGSGLFPFATAGIDVIYIPSPSCCDPLAWPANPEILTIPHMNNSFNVGAAAALGTDGGNATDPYLYLLGSGNDGGQIISRVLVADAAAGQWDGVEYWLGEGSGGWEGFSPSLPPPATLFTPACSETSLAFSAALGLFWIPIANTFAYNAVGIRTAPAVTGPWSDFIPVYPIPSSLTEGGAFCYAGKAHTELAPADGSELVLSFMCNTPNIPELLNRTQVYIPQLVRVTFTQ
jgi:hypothetical protein